MNIIFETRKTILSLNDTNWIKCEISDFEVSMGPFDSAQVPEIVCVYILVIFSSIVELKLVGLYKDYRFINVPNCNGSLTVKLPKMLLECLSYWVLR